MILIFAGYIHMCSKDILHGLYFFEVVFLYKIFTNPRKRASGVTPDVLQGVYFEVFNSFAHYFGIIVKEKISPFNQSILQ